MLELFLPARESLVNLAGAGTIVDADREDWRAYGATLTEGMDDRYIAQAQIDDYCVTATTLHADIVTFAVAPILQTVAILWVATGDDAMDWDDVSWFWNIRALRPGDEGGPTVLTTIDAARHPKFQELFRRAAADRVRAQPHVQLQSNSVPREALDDLAAAFEFEPFKGGQVSETIGNVHALPSVLLAGVNQDMRAYWLNDRRTGAVTSPLVHVHRPITQLRVPSPIRFHPRLLGVGLVGFRFSASFVTGPRRESVARLYHRDANWEDESLRWMTLPHPEYDFQIAVPSGSDILSAALADRGVQAEPNDKAQQVEGILAAVVGDSTLVVERLFAKVVQTLTGSPSRDLLHALENYVQKGIPDDLAEELRQASAFTRLPERSLMDIRSMLDASDRAPAASVLDRMVATGLAHRGIRANCPSCGLPDFVILAEAVPSPACRGCDSVASYTTSPIGEPQLRYRLSTLLHRVSLNGGIVPLQATAVLRSERAHVVPGADLFGGDSKVGETDLLGWRDQTLFTGEAKHRSGDFSPEQAAHDRRIAEAVNADQHILACPQSVDENTVALYQREFEDAGIDLRLLCGDHLTPP
jgi:hypothetical protein